jgi:hypothetical protein
MKAMFLETSAKDNQCASDIFIKSLIQIEKVKIKFIFIKKYFIGKYFTKGPRSSKINSSGGKIGQMM